MSEPPGERRPGAVARVLIVDDHDLARAGLLSLLDGLPSVEVVGQAATPQEALAAVGQLRPHLVLMDVRMPGRDGLTAARAVTTAYPATRVMMVSFWETPQYILEAYQAGAVGYISKGAPRAEIIAEIERVLLDRPFAASELARRVLDSQAIGSPSTARAGVDGLTPRLRQVLALLADGLTNHEIAGRLGSKSSTVKKQVETILRRLDVDNRTQAATIWIASGAERPDTP